MLNHAKKTYDFQDLLIQPAPASGIDSRKLVQLVDNAIGGVPIIAANMQNIGNFSMARALQEHKIFTAIQKHKISLADWDTAHDSNSDIDWKYIIPTVGADDHSMTQFKNVMDHMGNEFQFVCFDVANGHTTANMKKAADLQSIVPKNVKFIYGNIANPDAIPFMAEWNLNPDFVKVGIGSGSVCTTRLKTGIGVPQASLLDEFSEYSLHNFVPGIISDGGCRLPSDLVKAFMLDADMVMLGGMLAYHEEGREPGHGNEGDTMSHYGNSSEKANGYEPSLDYRTIEGKVTSRPSRGSVHNTVKDILGGIRSACTYLNCDNITELRERQSLLMIANRQADNYQ